GGHAMAAGLSLKAEHLEAFRRKMDRHVARLLTPEALMPKLDVDDEVPLVASHVKIAGEPRLMGKKNDHLSMYLQQEGKSIRAVGFGMGDLLERLQRAKSVSVAFTPQLNSWQGNESVELHLKDLKIDG